MATFKSGIRGAIYVNGGLLSFISSISLSIDREVAEATVMGQDYAIKRAGAYSGEFSGSSLVDMNSSALFSYVTSSTGTTYNIAVYPDRTSTSTYWAFVGQFTGYNPQAGTGDLWTADFSGIICEGLTAVGFT